MTGPTTAPTTIQLRWSQLLSLILAAAALAAAVTWALLVFAVDTGGEQSEPAAATDAEVLSSLSTQERQHVEGIAAMTEEQLAAAFGNVPFGVLTSLSPALREYVEGIVALTPEQVAASFGNVAAKSSRLTDERERA